MAPFDYGSIYLCSIQKDFCPIMHFLLKGCDSAQRYIYFNFSARPIKNPHYFFFVQVLFYFSLDKKKKYANPYKIVCFQFAGGQNFLHPGGQEYFFFADIQVI